MTDILSVGRTQVVSARKVGSGIAKSMRSLLAFKIFVDNDGAVRWIYGASVSLDTC